MSRMKISTPLVSIGLPVRNGEKYLPETLASIRAQTYSNFEVIISDNSSSDKTQEICTKYVELDRRFRYFRNEINIGVAGNFNRVFELSRGDYFKWWAYDDLCAPTYVERCVEVLNEQPSVVVCHTKTAIIDQKSITLGYYDDCLHFRSKKPHQRFRAYLFRRAGLWNAIYGLIRAEEFKKTPLHGDYLGADQVLLGELILRGQLHRVPEPLFFRRNHPDQFWRGNATYKKKILWFNPGKKNELRIPVSWRLFFEYLNTIWRCELGWKEESLCQGSLCKWFCKKLIKPAYLPTKEAMAKVHLISDSVDRNPWNEHH